MPNIRMVWWDYGRVLINHNTDDFFAGCSAMSNPSKKPHEIYSALVESHLVLQYDKGAINTEDFIKSMQRLIGFPDSKVFCNLWHRILSPNKAMWRLVSLLRRQSYPQGVISDTNEMQAAYVETTLMVGSVMQLRPRVYSFREGMLKDDPALFQRAIVEANKEYPWNNELLPEECVFIDDRLDNVKNARQMGWHAIHHDPWLTTKTIAQLVELGVRL